MIKKILKPHIIRQLSAQPKFKRIGKIAGLEYLNKYFKKLDEAHRPISNDIVISRRVDENISKDYRKDGTVAGNKSGRFSAYWTVGNSPVKYKRWDIAKKAAGNGTITKNIDADNQVSVLSSAIDSYDYYPDVRKLLVRYTSNPEKSYSFANVTKRRKDDLDNAASKGRFVNNVLRAYNRDNNY